MKSTELTTRHQHDRQLIDDFKLADAKIAVQNTHDITQQTFGEDSPEHAQSLINLGNWHVANGDYAAAEPLLKQAVQIIRRHQLSGCLNTELADALQQLGNLYTHQARGEDAQKAHEEALPLYQANSEANQAKIALLFNDLASSYGNSGQPEKALELYERSAEQHEQLFGMEHPYTALAYTNVATCYRIQGHHTEALSILKSTVQIQQRCSGDHPRTVHVLAELAAAHDAVGEFAAAEHVFQQAQEILLRCVNEHHAIFGRLLLRRAHHYVQQQQLDRALACLERALPIFLETFEEEHPAVHSTIQNIVVLNIMKEQSEEQFDFDE